MPLTLELLDGPDFVIQNAADDFIDNANNNDTNIINFDWTYNAQTAIDVSNAYGYDNSILIDAIEDSVEYLINSENITRYYGESFNQTQFSSDLEFEINNRYVSYGFYERYQSLVYEFEYFSLLLTNGDLQVEDLMPGFSFSLAVMTQNMPWRGYMKV